MNEVAKEMSKAFTVGPAHFGEHDALNLTLVRFHSIGVLHTTEELDLYYDLVDETWHGTVLDSDGWRDLEEDEMAALVEDFSLDGAVKDHLSEMESVRDLLGNGLLARINAEQTEDPSWLFYAETVDDLVELGFEEDDIEELASLLRADTCAAELMRRTVVVRGVESESAPEAYKGAEVVGFGFAPGCYRALQLIDNGTFPTSILKRDEESLRRLEIAGMLAILEDEMPITVRDVSNDSEKAFLLTYGEDAEHRPAARIVVDEEPQSWLSALSALTTDRNAIVMVNEGYAGYSEPEDLAFVIDEAAKSEQSYEHLLKRFEGHNGIGGLVKNEEPAPNLKAVASQARSAAEKQNETAQRESRVFNDER